MPHRGDWGMAYWEPPMRHGNQTHRDSKERNPLAMEPPLAVTVAKPKRSLDLRDMMDELPMLAALKDQKWMARLPRNMFPARKKSPRSGDVSPTDSDGALLSPGFLPTPRVGNAISGGCGLI
ncbi:unnamed protein product [Phytophthora lilii]|uniref:Unnamed protein product n=1 Tax=Phytophthora lilii TaxID=2077276 RepID=A0A9W6WNS9_9STRA|nr:unnamed protein product [Phytophthora lilii]